MPDIKQTKSDILDAVYIKTKLNRNTAKSAYNIIFSEISDALIKGKIVELRGFGTFELKVRKARKNARNPRTGEMVSCHQHKIVKFRAGQDLKLAVWNIDETASNSANEET